MNVYIYCGNNPVNFVDPSGYVLIGIRDLAEKIEGSKVKWNEETRTATVTINGHTKTYNVDDPNVTVQNGHIIINTDIEYKNYGVDKDQLACIAEGTIIDSTPTDILAGFLTGGIGLGKSIIKNIFSKGAGSAVKWMDEAGKIIWPDNFGFKGTPKAQTLKPGTIIDRYGSEGGKFASPQGTPFKMRSLPAENINSPYCVYKVVKPVQVNAGEIAPWFGQPGGGTQYMFNQPFSELIEQGIIRRVGK